MERPRTRGNGHQIAWTAGLNKNFQKIARAAGSLFKKLAGKAQEKAKADAYSAYVRVWLFPCNAASGDFSTGC